MLAIERTIDVTSTRGYAQTVYPLVGGMKQKGVVNMRPQVNMLQSDEKSLHLLFMRSVLLSFSSHGVVQEIFIGEAYAVNEFGFIFPSQSSTL